MRLSSILPQVASDGGGNFLVMLGRSAVHARIRRERNLARPRRAALEPGGLPRSRHWATRRRLHSWSVEGSRAPSPTRSRPRASRSARPGSAVCGDGTRVPTCEVCDDVLPPTATPCLTPVGPPACSRAVATASRTATSNATTATSRPATAATTPASSKRERSAATASWPRSGCQEECDDGNAQLGDGCSATCQVERIPGGGGKAGNRLLHDLAHRQPEQRPALRQGRLRERASGVHRQRPAPATSTAASLARARSTSRSASTTRMPAACHVEPHPFMGDREAEREAGPDPSRARRGAERAQRRRAAVRRRLERRPLQPRCRRRPSAPRPTGRVQAREAHAQDARRRLQRRYRHRLVAAALHSVAVDAALESLPSAAASFAAPLRRLHGARGISFSHPRP